MTILFSKTRLLALCLVLSVLTHVLIFYAVRMFGTYNFTSPVNLSHFVEVDIAKLADTASPVVPPENREHQDTGHVEENPATTGQHDQTSARSIKEQLLPEPKPDSSVSNEKRIRSPIRNSEVASSNSPDTNHLPLAADPKPSPLNTVGDFLSMKNEKLTYLVSMFGIPVGNAELEAKHENGEIWLTLRVKSSIAISSIFPVDNIVETRHISGRFIMTKIIQQEGNFRSDQGFTINLGKKKVTWSDNIGGRSQTTTVPTDEVIDTLSGIYLLRSRQLQIGNEETLHIFDSEVYADVPVEILRRETVRLLNFTNIETLVVRPLQKTAGLFRRTGDILIWMTDDANKVPVKIVTSVALGTVTVELLSAESTTPKEELTAK
jgi:hypothetical protein